LIDDILELPDDGEQVQVMNENILLFQQDKKVQEIVDFLAQLQGQQHAQVPVVAQTVVIS